MWAKIITIKRTKDLNYFCLCALDLFNTQVSQFELNYWLHSNWDAPVHDTISKIENLCSKSVILQILAKQINMRNFNKLKSNQMAHLWMLLLSFFFFLTCFLIVIVFKDLTSFNQVTNEFATRYADFQPSTTTKNDQCFSLLFKSWFILLS